MPSSEMLLAGDNGDAYPCCDSGKSRAGLEERATHQASASKLLPRLKLFTERLHLLVKIDLLKRCGCLWQRLPHEHAARSAAESPAARR